jgi:predicted polyphosphate/ATP-dependent NAD kinase
VKIGLIVNPVAGIGGRVGLKGSDGGLVEIALARGAAPAASARAVRALSSLAPLGTGLRLAGAGGQMGAEEAAAAGLAFEVLYEPAARTRREDTIEAARQVLDWEPQLILFAGGDGTARDIMGAIGRRCPVLGIPAGVKMHSAVFARTPRDAGALVAAIASRPSDDRPLILAEVMDRDDRGVPELFGTMLVPRDPRRMQPAKASPGGDEQPQMDAACRSLAQDIRNNDHVTVIGPGSTTFQLKHQLAPSGTLLGVDCYAAGGLIAEDADESAILAAIEGRPARLVLGVIGGQGFLLGRGNQQISPAVIRRVGRDNILGLASTDKLALLPDRTLYADTGDDELDAQLSGYVPVQAGAARRIMMPLNAHLRRRGIGGGRVP